MGISNFHESEENLVNNIFPETDLFIAFDFRINKFWYFKK